MIDSTQALQNATENFIPMRPERAGKLWLARLHEPMTAAGTSEGDADRTGEAAADAGPVPAPEEQAVGAP